ncbi:MAG TPA: hypothetical protein DEP66_07455 [Acidimicrobiaceae bacterium]|nr:hypothetical protein [Acidimicrobiaceae bacterium]
MPAVPAGLAVRDGELAIDGDPAADPVLVLRAAVEAARLRVPLSRAGLERLADAQPEFGDPWPDGARELFVELLAAGDDAIDVVEALDFAGVWTRLLPEWAPNRNRPQRSHYHRFTVDRHLLEAVATAARYTRRVARPDLLLMGALLHDLGKGYPGDHTEVGMRLAADIGRRCGYDADDTSTLVRLVQHHLLLTDTAHRRDLHDPLTIAQVAEATGTVEFLELLATLTEADCRATGPTAWTDWIADLVGTLVGFVADHLIGDANLPSRRRLLLTDAVEQMMSSADTQVVGAGNTVTVVAPDERGTLSRAAGALALRGLDVLQAEAYSSAGPPAMAVSVFRVVLPDTPVDWERVANDVRRAVGGGLALEARIVERARLYRRRGALAAATPPSTVTFDTTAATDATIVQVHTEDHIGVLYRLTRILTEMGLDIVSAKIQTMANEVVDTFYVVGPDGPTLTAEHQREIELALRHGLSAGQE